MRPGSRDERLDKSALIMKKISLYWALLVGLLSVVAQIIIFRVRFGRWNTGALFLDYMFFFLAGALGGLILIYFLNRETLETVRWVILIAFLLASPIAWFMMIVGGLLGVPGILLFPQIPWALFTWIGSWAGKFISRG